MKFVLILGFIISMSFIWFGLGRCYEIIRNIRETEEEIARIEAEIEVINREIDELLAAKEGAE